MTAEFLAEDLTETVFLRFSLSFLSDRFQCALRNDAAGVDSPDQLIRDAREILPQCLKPSCLSEQTSLTATTEPIADHAPAFAFRNASTWLAGLVGVTFTFERELGSNPKRAPNCSISCRSFTAALR